MQFVAREYLLDGDSGSFTGELKVLEEWYDGRRDWRRSVVRMRNGLLDLVGVLGLAMYD